MKALDPVEERLFPTLAAYARKVRSREVVAIVCIVLSAYIIGRDVLSAYRSRVATENMAAMPGRIAALEDQYQRDQKKELTVTRIQASDMMWRKERERKCLAGMVGLE